MRTPHIFNRKKAAPKTKPPFWRCVNVICCVVLRECVIFLLNFFRTRRSLIVVVVVVVLKYIHSEKEDQWKNLVQSCKCAHNPAGGKNNQHTSAAPRTIFLSFGYTNWMQESVQQLIIITRCTHIAHLLVNDKNERRRPPSSSLRAFTRSALHFSCLITHTHRAEESQRRETHTRRANRGSAHTHTQTEFHHFQHKNHSAVANNDAVAAHLLPPAKRQRGEAAAAATLWLDKHSVKSFFYFFFVFVCVAIGLWFFGFFSFNNSINHPFFNLWLRCRTKKDK